MVTWAFHVYAGGNVWMEKLDYTKSWLQAHLDDAKALGKPLLVEEFGKAIDAKKVYTGQLPRAPQKGAFPSCGVHAEGWQVCKGNREPQQR